MKPFSSFIGAVLCLVPTAHSLSSYSTGGGPTFAVGIPSSNSDNVYVQMSAPTSMQWVGVGIGQAMAGSTILVMYADGNGNVTVSPRKGTGEVEPKFDSTMKVELLSGSGIVDGNMVANVLCTTCSSKLSSTTATDSNWISAWGTGNALDSTDTSATITQHSGSNHRQFTFDLSQAQLTSDSNPFTSAAATTTSSGSSGSSSVGGGSSKVETLDKAHGIIMGVTVVLLFPLGSLSMRVFGVWWIHAIGQMFSFLLMIIGMILGIKLASAKVAAFSGASLATRTIVETIDLTARQYGGFGGGSFTGTPPWATATGTGGFTSPTSTSGSSSSGSGSGSTSGLGLTGASVAPSLGTIIVNTTHMIFGIVLVVLFLIQPILGMIHHKRYLKYQQRGAFGWAHLIYGRILMILAVVNGGLGLKLAGNTRQGTIAYAVIAAAMYLIYVVVTIWTAMRKRMKVRAGSRIRG